MSAFRGCAPVDMVLWVSQPNRRWQPGGTGRDRRRFEGISECDGERRRDEQHCAGDRTEVRLEVSRSGRKINLKTPSFKWGSRDLGDRHVITLSIDASPLQIHLMQAGGATQSFQEPLFKLTWKGEVKGIPLCPP
jgi:hypothetical protein